MNSRDKGKRGELEWASKCREHGFDARRGQQYSGNPDAPDVVTDLPVHFEVKRVERLNIVDAMDKARQESGDLPPVVAHRKNHCDWLVTMRADDWFEVMREYMYSKELPW